MPWASGEVKDRDKDLCKCAVQGEKKRNFGTSGLFTKQDKKDKLLLEENNTL